MPWGRGWTWASCARAGWSGLLLSLKTLLLMNRLDPDFPLVKGTLLVASALTVLAGATIAPSLPAMQVRFSEVAHADLLVRLVLTVPALFVVIGAPIAGLMVDRWGRKPLLVVSIPLYGLAESSGFLLESLSGILVGRALLGLAV